MFEFCEVTTHLGLLNSGKEQKRECIMDFAHYKILYMNDLGALAISLKLILFIYIWVGRWIRYYE